jgi:hypothetical protein
LQIGARVELFGFDVDAGMGHVWELVGGKQYAVY